jgi:SNF2 family DNA or RNA helicase
MKDFVYKNPPFEHQRKILEESCDKEYLSLFLKPGLGKSFIIINNVAYLYEKGEVDALVVVAPNGVHLNWVSDELPQHMPNRVMEKTRCHIWHSSKAKTKKAEYDREQLLKHNGLSILVVSYEASITDGFKAYMKRFFAKKKVLFCLDESHRIKGRTSRCKKTLIAMGAHAKYRRILTGTPLDKPVDLYAPIRFLSPEFWRSKGLGTAAEFDAKFCIQRAMSFGGRSFKQTVGYQNLELLKEYVSETGYSLTLEQAGIYLPPLTYSKRYYEMFPEQRKIYENLRDQFRHEFEDGLIVDCEAAITRLLRLQQVICGYLGTGPGEPIRRISEDKNPRLETCLEIIEDIPHQLLVWCKYTQDVQQLIDALGDRALRYDGQVDDTGRALAKKAFQAGDKQIMVMSSAGAEGHTLVGAKTAIFYSNSHRVILREQMEGRNYRISQKDPCHIIDIVCPGTVDGDILQALKDKFDIGSMLTGAKLREWL